MGVGESLSDNQPGVDAPEINSLTKFVISQGVTIFNYYMFHGGTNFGYWGARTLTSTYDYNAPIADRGLHDKYFEVKAIADFLRMFGTELTDAVSETSKLKLKEKSKPLPAGRPLNINSLDTKTMFEMLAAPSGERFIFLENPAPVDKQIHLSIAEKSGVAEFPSRGAIHMSPREGMILPSNIPISKGVTLRYTTAK